MSLESLKPLIKKTKSNLSPHEFQSIINIVFHDYESKHYDEIHNDMKNSLQEQIDLLVEDLLNKTKFEAKNISLLDIGCGTGMSSQLILNTKIGNFIKKITLLDTSSKMLELANEKAKKWNVEYQIINSDISELNNKYDVILICSVLHHIPDLEVFFKKIDSILNQNGILIHLQDPNGDYLSNENYRHRLEQYNSIIKKKTKIFRLSSLIPKSARKFINRKIGKKSYIDLVNEKLLDLNAIKRRMSADEIWSVTDIHVETKNSFENKGISFNFLKHQLSNFSIISFRSYSFYGLLKSDLRLEFQKKESELINRNDLSGRNIACVWRKN